MITKSKFPLKLLLDFTESSSRSRSTISKVKTPLYAPLKPYKMRNCRETERVSPYLTVSPFQNLESVPNFPKLPLNKSVDLQASGLLHERYSYAPKLQVKDHEIHHLQNLERLVRS